MYKKKSYEELSTMVLETLAGLLNSIRVQKEVIYMIFCILPKASQQYLLTGWLADQVEQDKTPLQHEIVDKAREIAERK